MQNACAVLYCLWHVWLDHIFPHYLINGVTFEKKVLEHKMFGFSLQLLSETLLSLRGIQPDLFIDVHKSSCKVPVILVRF